jgi:hypothetical protein
MVIRSDCSEFGLHSSYLSQVQVQVASLVPFFLLTEQCIADLSLNHPAIGPQVAHLCPSCRSPSKGPYHGLEVPHELGYVLVFFSSCL